MPFVSLPAALFSLMAFINEPLVSNDNAALNPVEPTGSVNKTLMLQLVNQVRQKGCKCGDTYYYPVQPVNWNSQLEEAAYSHASDMNTRKYFSHKSPEGFNAGVRIDLAGYKWMAFGENIALGYSSEKSVLEGWLKSPGHCKNIMNKTYKEMAVAKVGNYWTQEFATK